jgi:hypothetical protein
MSMASKFLIMSELTPEAVASLYSTELNALSHKASIRAPDRQVNDCLRSSANLHSS